MKKLCLSVLFCILSAGFSSVAIAADDVGITSVLVRKSARKMYLMNGDDIVREYTIRLGGNPVGTKIKEGDNRTPEGDYVIVSHNPQSAYHLSLKISYPTSEQIKKAAKNHYSAGGDIMIHGYPNKSPTKIFKWIHKFIDWTAGCIAVTNDEIEEIYVLVPDNTPIKIEP